MTRLTLLLITCATVLPAAGTLIINGTTTNITHVYARRAPSAFDAKKTILYILAVDRELSDESATWTLRSKLAPSRSGSRSPSPFNLQTANARVKGNLTLSEPTTLGDVTYIFDIAVNTEIETPIVEPPPPEAANSFLAYEAALRKGEKEAILNAIDPEKATIARNSPEWPQILAMIQDIEPTGIVVQKATIEGDDAVLMVTGLDGKKPKEGKVTMMRLNNQWLVKKEAWKNKP